MAPGTRLQGRRVEDVEDSAQPHARLEPGDYRRTRYVGSDGVERDWKWECRPPGEFPEVIQGSLANHEVTEHEDGTITVSPSILIQTTWKGKPVEWHGYLEQGVWRED